MTYPHAGSGTESYVPDNLIAGSKPVITKTVTIGTGEALVMGALLGRKTGSDTYLLSKVGAGDGSETPDAILAHDADASASDVEAVIYVEGEFNRDALTYGTGHTADSVAQGLRERGIHLRKIS